ncbi:uncharacterized protein LOC115965011 [Quercus lobata]|uniref:uncharacterized protein LOC115965011 n=1 Tax=Quercus lobata TaxID=97700 RepID=UPI001246A1B7|nr:uncharacterized protein LOC115965011 [Quercus lobata]
MGVDELEKHSSSEAELTSIDLKVEVQRRPGVEEVHTFIVQSGSSWMTPILSFLQDGRLPQDVEEATKVRKMAARFTILNGTLYKRGFSMPYLKCVDKKEAKYIKEEIHEGVCGDHEALSRIPRMIISDNGRQFDSQGFKDFCSSLGIKNQFSSPRNPQANGQTEDVTNRTLLKIIKARLDDANGAWLEELPNVLWAYRTTTRTPTGETPFRLTYGTEAVIPVEMGITSIRRETFHEESNDD